jgi:ribonuclease HII
MREYDQLYPQYGLAQNKGYGTPDHLEALQRHGPSPLHRFSYSPVREAGCWAVGAKQDMLPLTPVTDALGANEDRATLSKS